MIHQLICTEVDLLLSIMILTQTCIDDEFFSNLKHADIKL